jgi:hypothetical protein
MDAIAGSASPLNPKLETPYKIGSGSDFRCAMTNQCECSIVAIHSRSVIADANQLVAALLDRDFDRRRSGIERVLDELLHHRRWTLDHFAGSYLISHRARQNLN